MATIRAGIQRFRSGSDAYLTMFAAGSILMVCLMWKFPRSTLRKVFLAMTNKCYLAAVMTFILLLTGNLWPQAEFFRVDDVRPGMKGIGKTCYQGSTPEEFQVEILGVLRGLNPGSDAVLARFSGGPLAQVESLKA